MGDVNVKEELTRGDIFSVLLYRTGIVVCALSVIYAALFFFLASKGAQGIFAGIFPKIVFWAFIFWVDVSVFFLHLYSKKILRIIQSMSAFGTLVLVAGFAFFDFSLADIFNSEGVPGKIGLAGLGFSAAGFAGIGAKEAFCFHLNEGYAYGILSALLIIGHFFGIYSVSIASGMLVVIAALVTVFTVRKMFLPLHYDIGDKSKY